MDTTASAPSCRVVSILFNFIYIGYDKKVASLLCTEISTGKGPRDAHRSQALANSIGGLFKRPNEQIGPSL